MPSLPLDSIRIDKWLWAARFFKTRSMAQEAVALGRVLISGQRMKASREVRPGDLLTIRRVQETFVVRVQALSSVRGSASIAQTLYEETLESVSEREHRNAIRQMTPEPSSTIRGGRPTKREGRLLRRAKGDE